MSWFRRKNVVAFPVTPSVGLEPLTRTLVRLMRDYPGNWECGPHFATHTPTGITLWIANEDYGLRIWRHAKDAHKCPGSGDYNPAEKDRKALWRAYRTLAHDQLYHAVREYDPAALEGS